MAIDADESEEAHNEVTAETLSGGHIRIKLRIRFAIDASGTAEKAAKIEKGTKTTAATEEKK